MNTSAAQQSWPQAAERGDSMGQMSDDLDDFGSLFEFGDLGLENLAGVDPQQYGQPAAPFDGMNDGRVVPAATSAQDFGHGGQEHLGGPYTADPPFQQSMMPQYAHGMSYAPQAKPGFSTQPHVHVPPTPNSFEMHGQPGRFAAPHMDPQHQAMLEQRYQLRKDDAIAYTPMVSPAGTPQYNMQPEYTIPGAYFSPLTSPMLHAQNAGHQPTPQGFYTNPSTAPSSSATSPLDPNADVEMLGEEQLTPDSTNVRSRKSERRKAPTPRMSGDPLARVKQSPISKAIKRKSTTMLSSMTPLSEKAPPATSAGLQVTQPRNDGTEDGSISPEPLSEALMGPPPRPGSGAAPSPALVGRNPGASPAGPLGKAATPKSLLSMRGPQLATQQPGQASGGVDGAPAFEDIQLPEAAADNITPRPSLAHIDTGIPQSNSAEDTPIIASRKTPKLGPLSTPSSARPISSSASPSTAGTPLTASTPNALLSSIKPDSRNGRGNSKKRASMSISSPALVSPALRPRISPSIKPLLPEGSSLNSQTHALLLASKSNYQNLLEGNHLPGVNYPDSLSTGLTSKRTSHKVAEQGRRNRINEALREMQALLPKPLPSAASPGGHSNGNGKGGKDGSAGEGSPDAPSSAVNGKEHGDADGNGKGGRGSGSGSGEGDKDDGGAKSNNSKAATVESANEYIRKLQRENAALLVMQREHEELKRRFLGEEETMEKDAEVEGIEA